MQSERDGECHSYPDGPAALEAGGKPGVPDGFQRGLVAPATNAAYHYRVGYGAVRIHDELKDHAARYARTPRELGVGNAGLKRLDSADEFRHHLCEVDEWRFFVPGFLVGDGRWLQCRRRRSGSVAGTFREFWEVRQVVSDDPKEVWLFFRGQQIGWSRNGRHDLHPMHGWWQIDEGNGLARPLMPSRRSRRVRAHIHTKCSDDDNQGRS